MDRTSVFQHAKEAVLSLDIPETYDRHIQSVVKQLEFLIDFENGEQADFELLERVNIGIIAARIIEDCDLTVAEKL